VKSIALGGDVVELIDMVAGSGGAVVVYHHLEIGQDVKV
jgi:hypothetical protein